MCRGAVAVCAAMLAGCGERAAPVPPPAGDVRQAVEAYYAAMNAEDFAAACALLDFPAPAEQCVDVLKTRSDRPHVTPSVLRVRRTNDDEATVLLRLDIRGRGPITSSATWRRTEGRWRLVTR